MHNEYIRRSLQQLEEDLKDLDLWSPASPAADAFESTTPFFHDRMAFSDWLQWVLIPRFRSLLDARLPFPDNCAIAPMAEVQYANKGPEYARLIRTLHELDKHVMAASRDETTHTEQQIGTRTTSEQ